MLKKWLTWLYPVSALFAQSNLPDDQVLVLFGSSGYVIYKVIDFANDHGYRYAQVLSYEFQAFGHTIKGSYPTHQEGRYFELRDENVFIGFICFNDAPPDDPYIIDIDKYRHLLDDVHAGDD